MGKSQKNKNKNMGKRIKGRRKDKEGRVLERRTKTYPTNSVKPMKGTESICLCHFLTHQLTDKKTDATLNGSPPTYTVLN